IDEDHHAAALADERRRTRTHRQRPILGERHQPALGADIAHAIGARDAEPGLRDHGRELASERDGRGIEGFAEARGEHGRAAGAATFFLEASRSNTSSPCPASLFRRSSAAEEPSAPRWCASLVCLAPWVSHAAWPQIKMPPQKRQE